jgi:OPA family glycerol-3-phosphate transporter-like MFS transporter 1/2
MRLKIRCDGKSEKFCKIFWEVNKAYGTGSASAAIGPLLTGYISAKSWTAVFTMLMVAALIAGLLLSRLVMAEVSAKLESWRSAAPNDLPVSSVEGA